MKFSWSSRPLKHLIHNETFETSLPIQSLFLTVAKVERYSSFIPWCNESRWVDPSHQVKLCNSPVSSNAILGVNFGLFNEKYTSTVTYQYPLYVKAVASDDSLFKHLETTWKFSESTSSGFTLLNFYLSFEFKSFIHQRCATIFLNKISKTMVNSFINETKRGLYTISQN